MKTHTTAAREFLAEVSTARLTARQRRTCMLAWFDGLNRAQIAAREGVSVNAVKRRLQFARRRLRAAGIPAPSGSLRRQRLRPYSLATTSNV